MTNLSQPMLAVLDFDGTLIDGQSQKMLVEYFYEKGYIGIIRYVVIILWFVAYRLHFFSQTQGITEYVIKYFKGKRVSDLDTIFDSFFYEKCIPKLRKNSIGLVSALKDHGFHTLLISTAIDPIISRVQKNLGIDKYLCTTLEHIGGIYTGKLAGSSVYGEEKLRIAAEYARQKGYEQQESYIFADHDSDIPLLLSSRHPVAVNPWPILLSYSQRHKWPVLYLDNDESFQYFKSHTLS